MSYREDGLCVVKLLDVEVSSGSLSCHSQSATPFCETEGKESGGKQGGTEGPGYPRVPSLGTPRDPPDPSTAADFQFFFELHATSSRSNSLLRPPLSPPDSPLPCLPPPPPPPPSALSSCPPFLSFSFSLFFRHFVVSLRPTYSTTRRLHDVARGRVEANSENPD